MKKLKGILVVGWWWRTAAGLLLILAIVGSLVVVPSRASLPAGPCPLCGSHGD